MNLVSFDFMVIYCTQRGEGKEKTDPYSTIVLLLQSMSLISSTLHKWIDVRRHIETTERCVRTRDIRGTPLTITEQRNLRRSRYIWRLLSMGLQYSLGSELPHTGQCTSKSIKVPPTFERARDRSVWKTIEYSDTRKEISFMSIHPDGNISFGHRATKDPHWG